MLKDNIFRWADEYFDAVLFLHVDLKCLKDVFFVDDCYHCSGIDFTKKIAQLVRVSHRVEVNGS